MSLNDSAKAAKVEILRVNDANDVNDDILYFGNFRFHLFLSKIVARKQKRLAEPNQRRNNQKYFDEGGVQ